MMYYIANVRPLALVNLTEKDFITSFGEEAPTPKGICKKYFYNETDKLIYCYYPSGKALPSSKYPYTAEQAESLLLSMAIEQAEQSGKCFLPPANTPQDLSKIIENYIDYLDISDTWEQEIFNDLSELNRQLKSIF
ncbi:hypothetical protein A1D22_09185 [Pasteurellaceae bacterium LFhippo2]|nr:hypothetical protein [Pasteurellaceae bacterium LFhippo2]